MNIGIDIRPLMSSTRAGVGEYTYELLDAIFKIDKTNKYFLFYNSYSDVSSNIPKWSQDNVHYVSTKWPNKLFNMAVKLFNFPKVDKILRKSLLRTLHSPSSNLDYFFSPNFNFTSLPTNTKSVLTVHDLSFEFFPEFFSTKRRLWHWAINPKKQCEQAAIIITPSENTKRDIVDIYNIPAGKIKVIYPGVNCHLEFISGSFPAPREIPKQVRDDIQKKYDLPGKFILFLGTVEPRKNITGLIEAFEQCYSLLPTAYSLIIAGHTGWNDQNIFKAVQKSPAKDRIHFIGSIKETDKHILYSLASLFVYPSFYEGFGFPVVEAMSCGTPVITSNRSSLPEVTASAAYLVNPNRPSELAKAIIDMLTNETLRENFKKLGLEQAQKFSWTKSAQEFMGLL